MGVEPTDVHEGLSFAALPVCVTAALLEKLDQQSADLFRLLLLDPMPGSLHQMAALPLSADLIPYLFQVRWPLAGSPVAFSGDEAGRHIDRAAGEHFEIGDGRQRHLTPGSALFSGIGRLRPINRGEPFAAVNQRSN